MVKLETCITETLNYFTGIIISVKTRSERQLLRLKQMNIQLAAKIQHLEFSCSEKVRQHVWGKCHLFTFSLCFSLPGPCSDTALGPGFLLLQTQVGHPLLLQSYARCRSSPTGPHLTEAGPADRLPTGVPLPWGPLSPHHLSGTAQKVN